MTRAEMRRIIPYPTFLKMLATGSLTGVLPVYDHTGEECGPAQPLTAQQRIDIADKLLRKGLPDLKSDDDVEKPPLDVHALTELEPEQIKRMSVAQIREAIEASFTPIPSISHEPITPPLGAIDI